MEEKELKTGNDYAERELRRFCIEQATRGQGLAGGAKSLIDTAQKIYDFIKNEKSSVEKSE